MTLQNECKDDKSMDSVIDNIKPQRNKVSAIIRVAYMGAYTCMFKCITCFPFHYISVPSACRMVSHINAGCTPVALPSLCDLCNPSGFWYLNYNSPPQLLPVAARVGHWHFPYIYT